MPRQFGDFVYTLNPEAAEAAVGQFLASKGVTSDPELQTWLAEASPEDRAALEDAFFGKAITIAPAEE